MNRLCSTFTLFILFIFYFPVPNSTTTFHQVQPYENLDFLKSYSDLIGSATSKVDMFIYKLNSTEIFDSIRKKCEKGIHFRLYVDLQENSDPESMIVKLSDKCPSTFQAIFDSNKVHAKLIVVDSHKILLSSNNLVDGIEKNVESALFSDDWHIVDEVAQAFEEWFPEEIHTTIFPQGSLNSQKSLQNTVPPIFYVDKGLNSYVLDMIDQSQTKIEAAIYKFSDSQIYSKLQSALSRGVIVHLYLDGTENNVNGSYALNLEQQFPQNLILNFSPNTLKMHSNFVIYDSKKLSVGSFDWSKNENSMEFLLISQDVFLVSQAEKNWNLIVEESTLF